MKFTIIAVLVGLLTSFVVHPVQPRARLTFPDYDKINNFDEIFFRGRLPFPIGVRGGTGLLPRATRSNSATGPLPVCPTLLRVGTHGTENRAQPSPLNATKRAPTEADVPAFLSTIQGSSIVPLYLPPISVFVSSSRVYVPPPLAPSSLPVPPVFLYV